MKYFKSSKISTISLIILFVTSVFLMISPLNVNVKSNEALPNSRPKSSQGLAEIHINGNQEWLDFKNAGGCDGFGTLQVPYVIRDLTITGDGSGCGILIENSDVYFIIEHCTIYNTETAIRLQGTKNGQLIDNDCSHKSRNGIAVVYGENNKVIGNTINENGEAGICMNFGVDNIISNNIVNNNYGWGMFIMECDRSTITGNTVNYNTQVGILIESDAGTTENNIVSGNTVNNNGWNGIYLGRCRSSIISGNNLENNEHSGIQLRLSDHNEVSENEVHYSPAGIGLDSSNYNSISFNNLLHNDLCILESSDCIGNIFENNIYDSFDFSVHAIILSNEWVRDSRTSLPIYKTIIEYYILNSGENPIENLNLEIIVNGEIIEQKVIPLIGVGSYYKRQLTLNTYYDNQKYIEIIATKGIKQEKFSYAINADLSRSPSTIDIAQLFITPDDPIVVNILQEILDNDPIIEWIAIRDWVGDNIDYIPKDDFDFYHHGVRDYWQLPRETIYSGLGDCEDHAILLASLLRANGCSPNDVWVVLGYKSENGELKGHAWVSIKVGFLWYNIESIGDALYTLLGEHFYLNGYNAVCMFNDMNYQEIGYLIKSKCPVDLIVKDPDGLIIGKDINEIPDASYYELDLDGDGELDDQIRIPNKKEGNYEIVVIPEPNAPISDTYTLEIFDGTNNYILAKDVQIQNIPNLPYIVESKESETIPIIPATIDFDPDTLNLKSNGKWVTVYIELPIGHGYDVSMINFESITLNNQIYAELEPIEINDYDNDGIPDLMVKFSRQAVQDILEIGNNVEITISGRLVDGSMFKGKDMIKVIDKGNGKIKSDIESEYLERYYITSRYSVEWILILLLGFFGIGLIIIKERKIIF